ncbi:GT4 family glycosyltransferase PelF [Pseudovibrio sp. Ad26]|uniref:GT4 family glycosyltransferase PelF n=1 Tax=Pseudovibrio sp. Ad26 TaxID=989410 RepID=UPI0007AE511C|nr:GT4 family glycosyltransferase PelF [Pseudovibrio sp. Ad26]KZK99331.1 D-inositol 3-phosphate glycosyltransferase [Pseudovibrio sp. Ad26]
MHSSSTTDVCIIVEGCYPYVAGGVSSWINWLISGLPDLTFSVVAVLSSSQNGTPKYKLPPNVKHYQKLALFDIHDPEPAPDYSSSSTQGISRELRAFLKNGNKARLYDLDRLVNSTKHPWSINQLTNSDLTWNVICQMYEEILPETSFHHFFWAWYTLFGGLFAILKAPMPQAKVYHTISTGYAGLFAARAALSTHAPAIITEHGIYTNERRIEILLADWIEDSINKGFSLDDPRLDLRDLWISAFEAFARCCYNSCSDITTLYKDNQLMQLSQGACQSKMQVIPNGINLNKFKAIQAGYNNHQPTVALIGRVVAIKDVKSFIHAVGLLRNELPDVTALILGPTDEEPTYFEECQKLTAQLNLEETITFTGPVNVAEYLSAVDLVALTSLSEAQPLVLLEAGAAGIPCVATDVGSCREVLEGRADDPHPLGSGGIITELVSPSATAQAMAKLLRDDQLRQQYGAQLRQRIERDYNEQQALKSYRDLYERNFETQHPKAKHLLA